MQTQTEWRVVPTLAWNEAWATWMKFDHIKKGGGVLSEKAMAAYLQDLRHFSRFYEQYTSQPFSPELLDRTVVQAYFEWQDGSHVAPASRNRRLASLRVFVRWCLTAGLLAEDPTVRVARLDGEKLPPKSKSPDECKVLEKTAKAGKYLAHQTARYQVLGLRDRVIWGLLYDVGLRISSVAALDIEGLRLDDRTIVVWMKGSRIGEFHISKRLCKLIGEWLKVRPGGAASGAVITDWHGQRLTTGQIRRRLYEISEAAGVTVHPHDLRHTFVYRAMDEALENGHSLPVALDIVRQLAGHRDVRTTMTYLRASREDLRSVVERM